MHVCTPLLLHILALLGFDYVPQCLCSLAVICGGIKTCNSKLVSARSAVVFLEPSVLSHWYLCMHDIPVFFYSFFGFSSFRWLKAILPFLHRPCRKDFPRALSLLERRTWGFVFQQSLLSKVVVVVDTQDVWLAEPVEPRRQRRGRRQIRELAPRGTPRAHIRGGARLRGQPKPRLGFRSRPR